MGWVPPQSSVGLVGAQEPETEKLPPYFAERGFGVHRWATLVDTAGLVGVKDALVLFADSFAPEAIITWLEQVSKAAPGRLVIVLTATPAQFSGPTALRGENTVLLVRPVLAWQLIDVIRNHIARHVGGRA